MSFNKAIDISFSACHAWSEIFRIGKKISFGTFVAIRHATYRWSFRDTSDVAACHNGRLKGDVQRLFAEDKAAQLVSRNSGSNTHPLLLRKFGKNFNFKANKMTSFRQKVITRLNWCCFFTLWSQIFLTCGGLRIDRDEVYEKTNPENFIMRDNVVSRPTGIARGII